MKITSAADISTHTVSGLLLEGAGAASSAGAASAAAGSVAAVASAGAGAGGASAAGGAAGSAGAPVVSAPGAAGSRPVGRNPVRSATQLNAAGLTTCGRVFRPGKKRVFRWRTPSKG